MNIRIAVTLLFLFSGSVFSQSDTSIRFFDWRFRATQERGSAYKSVLIVQKMNDGNWSARDYYAETGKIMINAYYPDSNLTKPIGLFEIYHRNGRVRSKGNYVDGKKVGVWKSWYDNGVVKDSMVFNQHGNITGVKKGWRTDGTLMDSVNYTDGGIGMATEWHSNGVKKGEGEFVNESRTGTWKFYRKTGIISAEEMYAADTVVSIRCFNESGEISTAECFAERDAVFPRGLEGWQRYLVNRLTSRQNELARKAIPGTVYISFVVDIDGTVIETKVENPKGGFLEEFALATISNSPKWIPAIQHNMPVKAYRRQPITFQAE